MRPRGDDALGRPSATRRALLIVAGLAPKVGVARGPDSAVEARLAIDVAITRDADEFHVRAEAFAKAPRAAAWSVLTDYDRLADFVPGMVASRLQSRDGADVTVRQQGRVGLLFFSREFALTLRVAEREPDSIDMVQVDGSFVRYEARYELSDIDSRSTRIRYRADFVPRPEQAPPPIVGIPAMRATIRGQLAAVVREIERRAELRH